MRELAGEGLAKSAAERLAGVLQDAIQQGEFRLGHPLPSERELMSLYEVSRPTVREALRVLGAHGLITVRRGRTGGSFISSPTSHAVGRSLDLFIAGQEIRFIDLVFAREAIEPAAAAQAALSRTEEQLDGLRRLSERCDANVRRVSLFVAANLEWHLAVAEASNNPLFPTFLRSIWTALQTATFMKEFDAPTRKTVAGVHWQIFEAIRLRDAEAAKRRMARHLSAYSERLSAIDLSPKVATARTQRQAPGPAAPDPAPRRAAGIRKPAAR